MSFYISEGENKTKSGEINMKKEILTGTHPKWPELVIGLEQELLRIW